ncbi:MAG TPA: TolC family protein [Candidatus Tidjanibacter faecipullorum]|uniref:TolC family protein n=1 Tax=Candidatus Tidjanibacter faecipullorum TaxID=2838766 RepID=A0A9D2DCN3_9BACT|nr:TolC family protein [Candidatus Tidjanibacter faecipullorum]
MRKHIIFLLALPLLTSSCGIYNQYKPTEEVAPDLFGENVAVTDTLSLGNVDWREMFTDPILQRHIDSALVRNTDLQTAYLRVQEAEASLMSARLAYIPSFSLSPQATLGTGGDLQNATMTYSLPLTASWEIDIFGKLTNQKRAAKAAYYQSQEYAQAVRTQIIASVANTYYTLLMLDAQYAITQETEKTWRESVEATRALKEAGYMNEAALAQTEATYYSIYTSMLDLKEQINQAENAMSLLLFETPQAIERGSLYDQNFTEEFSVGIPLQMLSNRPDVRSAEQALAQAFYMTNAARSAFYPSITLSGSIGWTNSIAGAIVNPMQAIASAVGSITEPLFNRRMNVAQLRIAKAQQEEARLAFQQTLLNAGSEVNDALMQYQTAHQKAEYYVKQIDALSIAAESTRLLMEHGSTNYLEVLTAQQSLLTAQLTQVANRFSEIQSLISLYQALGGGREM